MRRPVGESMDDYNYDRIKAAIQEAGGAIPDPKNSGRELEIDGNGYLCLVGLWSGESTVCEGYICTPCTRCRTLLYLTESDEYICETCFDAAPDQENSIICSYCVSQMKDVSHRVGISMSTCLHTLHPDFRTPSATSI